MQGRLAAVQPDEYPTPIPASSATPYRRGGGCVHLLQRHLVDHLLKGAEAVNTGRVYLANLRIEEAVYESDETGRRIELTGDAS